MMINEATKIGVKVIEFRQENALNELYDFLQSKDVVCKKPKPLSGSQLKSTIGNIVSQWNEENEGLEVVRKLKELTK